MWIVLPCQWMQHEDGSILSEWKTYSDSRGDNDNLEADDTPVMIVIELDALCPDGTVWTWCVPWAIRSNDVGTIWTEESLVYDDDLGVWELEWAVSEGLTDRAVFRPSWSSPIRVDWDALKKVSFDGRPLPTSTQMFYRDYLKHWYSPPAHVKSPILPDLRLHALFRQPLTDPAVRLVRSFALLEALLSDRHEDSPFRHGGTDRVWGFVQLWKEWGAMGLHHLLRWVWPPPNMIRYAPHATVASLSLPYYMLLHVFYLDRAFYAKQGCKEIVHYWTDERIYPLWRNLRPDVRRAIDQSLMFYLPMMTSSISHVDRPLLLPDPLIPRVVAASPDDPLGDRYRLFNPCGVIDPTTGRAVWNLRTADYDLSTYRTRDLEKQYVTTRNFISTDPDDPTAWMEWTERPPQKESSFDPESGIRGLEDVRLFYFKRQLFFLANACDRPRWGKMPVVVFGHLDPTTGEASTVVLDYGQAVEKNWAPLVHEERVLAVYGYHPLVILDLTPLARLPPQDYPPKYRPRPLVCDHHPGEGPLSAGPLLEASFRGSGTFVEESTHTFLGIIHQVVFDGQRRRKYFHRWIRIVWDASNETVAWSFSTPFTFHGSACRVEYALGVLRDPQSSRWLIPFSCGDDRPAVRELMQEDIDRCVRWSAPVAVPLWPLIVLQKFPILSSPLHALFAYLKHSDDTDLSERILSPQILEDWIRLRLASHDPRIALVAKRAAGQIWETIEEHGRPVRWTLVRRRSRPSQSPSEAGFWFETRDGRVLEDTDDDLVVMGTIEGARVDAEIPHEILIRVDRILSDVIERGVWNPWWSPLALPLSDFKNAIEGWPAHTYWINRRCDKERREAFLHRFDRVVSAVPAVFHRIEAIDGSAPSFRTEWPLCRYIHSFHLTESGKSRHSLRTLALTLSHFKVLETALTAHLQRGGNQTDTDWILVLEDDACLDHVSAWPCPLVVLLRSLPDTVGLCSLARLFPLKEELYTPSILTESLRYYGTTLAYLVRVCAIPRMLETVHCTPSPRFGVADREIFRACRMEARMTRFPWFTFPRENESTIHQEEVGFQEECRQAFRDHFMGTVSDPL